ncbi:MAG: SseB family protein [Bdellovibrionota bacterium]
MVFKSFFGKKEEEKEKNQQQPPVEVKQEIKSQAKTNSDEPTPAVQLEHAMAENARQDTQETRSRVYQELLFSDLLLALVDTTPAPPAPQAQNEGTPQNINVAIMSNPQGIQFVAAFTRAEAAKLWRVEGGQYVSIRGQDIFKLIEPSPADFIVVNPGSSPFVTLSKAEYHSLAQGIVPQSPQSPVQTAANPGANPQEAGMQISFPPDAFTNEQKQAVHEFLSDMQNVEAAALGALLPPNSPNKDNWLRTIFLRTKQTQNSQEDIQKFCIDIRDKLMKNSEHFADVQFEVGMMPDANFWLAIHQNKFALFDKNPPKNPEEKTSAAPLGARKA